MALKAETAAGLIAEYIRRLIAEADEAASRYRVIPPVNQYAESWLKGTIGYYEHAAAWLMDHERKWIRTGKHTRWVQEQLAAPLRKGAKERE